MASTGAVPPAISLPVAAKPHPMQTAGANYKMASAGAMHQAISPPVATNPQPMQAADATPILHAPTPVREPPTVTKRHSLDTIRHPNTAGALLQDNVVSPTVRLQNERMYTYQYHDTSTNATHTLAGTTPLPGMFPSPVSTVQRQPPTLPPPSNSRSPDVHHVPDMNNCVVVSTQSGRIVANGLDIVTPTTGAPPTVPIGRATSSVTTVAHPTQPNIRRAFLATGEFVGTVDHRTPTTLDLSMHGRLPSVITRDPTTRFIDTALKHAHCRLLEALPDNGYRYWRWKRSSWQIDTVSHITQLQHATWSSATVYHRLTAGSNSATDATFTPVSYATPQQTYRPAPHISTLEHRPSLQPTSPLPSQTSTIHDDQSVTNSLQTLFDLHRRLRQIETDQQLQTAREVALPSLAKATRIR